MHNPYIVKAAIRDFGTNLLCDLFFEILGEEGEHADQFGRCPYHICPQRLRVAGRINDLRWKLALGNQSQFISPVCAQRVKANLYDWLAENDLSNLPVLVVEFAMGSEGSAKLSIVKMCTIFLSYNPI